MIKLRLALTALFMGTLGCSSSSSTGLSGTGDSGGGNLYRGRPLESYIRKPQDLTAFKNFVAPKMPDRGMGQVDYLYHAMFINKTWYFVPGPLHSLPSGKIGSAVPTEQVALQDFDAIWIDTDLFEKMTMEDQARILVHEFLLGAKLLRLDSPYHSCLLRSEPRWVESCQSISYRNPRGKPSDLTPADYSQIRTVAQEIFRATPANAEEWQDLLGRSGFDDPPSFVIPPKGSERTESLDTIAQWIRSAAALGYVPSYGYDTEHLMQQYPDLGTNPPPVVNWRPHERCSIVFEFGGGNQIAFRLRMGSKELQYSSKYTKELRLRRRDEYGTMVWEGHLWDEGVGRKLGDRTYLIMLGFNDEASLHFVEITEMACANDNCTQRRNPNEGLAYICSAANVIRYY